MGSAYVATLSLICLGRIVAPPNSVEVRPSVDVIVTSMWGEAIDNARVTALFLGPNRTETKIGSHVIFNDLRPGLYEFEISGPGFIPKKITSSVEQPRLLLRVGLKLGYPDNGNPAEALTIRAGRLSPGRSYSDYWVRLVPVLGDDTIEGFLDSSGIYTISGLSPGRYMICILKGDKVVAFDQVFFTGKQTSIDIKM
jgi:hypothetical protein